MENTDRNQDGFIPVTKDSKKENFKLSYFVCLIFVFGGDCKATGSLINWRIFNFNEVPLTSTHVQPVVNSEEPAPNREIPQRGARQRELLQAVNQLSDANVNEVINVRHVVVVERMSNKLTG